MSKKAITYKGGFVVNRKGEEVTNQQDAWREQALCGCGPDCCDNVYHWIDVITNTHYVEYVRNGVKVLRTYDDFLANGY